MPPSSRRACCPSSTCCSPPQTTCSSRSSCSGARRSETTSYTFSTGCRPTFSGASADAVIYMVCVCEMCVCGYSLYHHEVLGRDSPGRVGWISLAVVALGREM
jgi:hypothetical protein